MPTNTHTSADNVYDEWLQLEKTKAKVVDGETKNPSSNLMDMMKDLYDKGDDTMKKTLGEAMEKSRRFDMMQQPVSKYEDLDALKFADMDPVNVD